VGLETITEEDWLTLFFLPDLLYLDLSANPLLDSVPPV
jgi:hypothetical protein